MTATTAPTRRTGRDRFGRALAWLALATVLICGAAELLAGPGYRIGWWGLGRGLQLLQWGATFAGVGGLLALVAALLTWRAAALPGFGVAVAALLIGAIAVGPPLLLWRQAARLPHIHDISTDSADPPLFVAILPLRQNAPNSTHYTAEVAARQKAGYPDIGPALLDLPPPQALRRAEQVARAMGWQIVAVVPAELRLEATATTRLFGFKDDVVIRVRPQGHGSRVDMRSESRLGGFDFGTNARRVRTFMKKLRAAAAVSTPD